MNNTRFTYVISGLGAIAMVVAAGAIADAMALDLPGYALPALGAGLFWLKVG